MVTSNADDAPRYLIARNDLDDAPLLSSEKEHLLKRYIEREREREVSKHRFGKGNRKSQKMRKSRVESRFERGEALIEFFFFFFLASLKLRFESWR